MLRELPSPLALDGGLVGRSTERRRLDRLWDAACAGTRQAALIGGEPGIGKTALAAAVAATARDAGAAVLYGRCGEDGRETFAPYTQAFGQLVGAMDDSDVLALGHHASHLARLLPELSERLPSLAPVTSGDPAADRFGLFEGVVALVGEATAAGPVLLVLDDLHWAAPPALALLRHLLRADLDMRLLVVATYRDTEVDRTDALTEVLADLRREVAVERLTLGGIGRQAVEDLVADVAGPALGDRTTEVADALHRQTGGNPFFLTELLQHLAERRADAGVHVDDGRVGGGTGVDEVALTDDVLEVVRRRLARLSPPVRRVLATAAVAGPEFDLRLLQASAGPAGSDDVLDALGEGVRARLLAGDGARYTFAHALVRQTLLRGLSAGQRARLHEIVGAALEASAPDDHAAIAYHLGRAGSPATATRAADHALEAARRARSRAAFEEAIAHLERGLEAVARSEPLDRQRRCDLLLELGELQRYLRYDEPGHLGIEAAADARELRSAVRLARAATVALVPTQGVPDPVGAALAEEALEALTSAGHGGDDELRIRVDLMVLLALHRIEAEGRREEGLALAAETVNLAAGGPPDVEAMATYAAWRWSPRPDAAEIQDVMARLPTELHTAELLSYLPQAHAVEALDRGDIDAFDAVTREIRDLAVTTHGWYPTYISLSFQATRALLDGRWSDADEILARLLEHAGSDSNATNVWAVNSLLVLREQGRLDEVLPLVEVAVAVNPAIPAYRAALAMVQAELGLLDAAAETCRPVAGEAVLGIVLDQLFALTFVPLAEAFARTCDVESCRHAYARMTDGPLCVGRVATVGGTILLGACDRALGMLAATLGHHERAEHHYEAALAIETGLGARPHLARTRTWFARMLLDRRADGDADRAAALLAAALADARDLDMVAVAAEIEALQGGAS